MLLLIQPCLEQVEMIVIQPSGKTIWCLIVKLGIYSVWSGFSHMHVIDCPKHQPTQD